LGVGSSLTSPTDAGASALVGRQNELVLLSDHLVRLFAGTGGVVLISGPTGIGKTTLVEALRDEAAARGTDVLLGGCYDLMETPPYGPWLELAERLAESTPDAAVLRQVLAHPDSIGPGGNQGMLFSAVRDCLASIATGQPLVVVLEDLHWADSSSIDLFRQLGRQSMALPVLLIGTYRTEEVTRQHRLYATLPVLVREAQATRIDLRPLNDDMVRLLVKSRYPMPTADRSRLVNYLQARAEGNPFFLNELLRALEADGVLSRSASDADHQKDGWRLGTLGGTTVPELVRQVLDRRLDRVAERDRQLLALAAVIGQEVPLLLWSEAGRIGQEALLELVDRAVAAHVLETPRDGATVRFVHALVREALYEGVLPPRRRLWHGRVAEVLLAQQTPDPDTVAYHFRQAGDQRAGEWLVRAGERAQSAYAWLTAAELYEAALAQLEGNDAVAGERARLLLVLAQLRRYTAPEWGIAHLPEAERLARRAGDWALAAAAQFDRGHLRCMARDFEAGLTEMKAGLAGLEVLSPAERARVPSLAVLGARPEDREHYHRGVLVLFFGVLGRLAEARASTRADVSGMTARELLGRGWVYAALGEPEQARQAFAGARVAYDDQHWEVGTTFFYELDLVVLRYQTDRLAERWSLADQAEAAWRRASGALPDLSPRLARLPLLVLEGQWTEARELAVATLAAPHSNDAWRRYPGRFLAWLAREQGDEDLAWRVIREELPAGPRTQPGATWFLPALELQHLAAMLAIDAGDLATARGWLEARDRWLAWSGAVLGRAEGHLAWAIYAYASGDPALAQQHAMQALACAESPRQPLAQIAAHRLLGEIAAGTGHASDVVAHLEAALGLAEACTAPYERALTLLALATLRRATGDRAAVEALITEVRTICAPLGARRALARAATLASHPFSLPRRGYPDGLSPREAEVLMLIATGDSNQEIAERLFLSVRTVERHINSLYRKIDARGRVEAAAYAARHALLPDGGAEDTANRRRR
jgi:DNA-binding CsgD family transcriptional regulator/tetratricopeptide (TPR) repeat protein